MHRIMFRATKPVPRVSIGLILVFLRSELEEV